ncbi:P43 5S RNA-binding protein [Bienertia sinuspersici]
MQNVLVKEYSKGVAELIAFATKHAENPDSFLCPSVDCHNMIKHSFDDVEEHLFGNEIIQTYKCWIMYGEQLGDIPSNIDTMMNDVISDDGNDEAIGDFTLDEDRLEETAQVLGENIDGSSERFETV